MNNMSGMERVFRARITISPILAIALAVLLCMPSAVGSQVGTLNAFTNGTVANADEVNQNFTDIQTAVNDNDTRITALEGAGGPGQRILGQGIQPGASSSLFGIYGQSGSSGFADVVAPTNGSLSALTVKARATLAAGSSITVTVLVNGSPSASSVTLTDANGTTLVTDPTVVNVSAGDLVQFQVSETAGTAPGTSIHSSVLLQ